jgi:hypothetical protein
MSSIKYIDQLVVFNLFKNYFNNKRKLDDIEDDIENERENILDKKTKLFDSETDEKDYKVCVKYQLKIIKCP